jgi:hypothetical protein
MTFAEHQAETARWMGYPDAAAMNAVHDPLHLALCHWLGIPSHSMACAAGEAHDAALAAVEESAVLHVQRLAAHHGVGVPS